MSNKKVRGAQEYYASPKKFFISYWFVEYRGLVKVLKDTKLFLDNQGGQPDMFRIIQNPLFYKPVTVR